MRSTQGGPISTAMGSMLDMIGRYTDGVPQPPPDFPGAILRTSHNNYGDFSDTNNLSLVSILTVCEKTFLIPGDVETPGWQDCSNEPIFKPPWRLSTFSWPHTTDGRAAIERSYFTSRNASRSSSSPTDRSATPPRNLNGVRQPRKRRHLRWPGPQCLVDAKRRLNQLALVGLRCPCLARVSTAPSIGDESRTNPNRPTWQQRNTRTAVTSMPETRSLRFGFART
jgi:hypothetical protein